MSSDAESLDEREQRLRDLTDKREYLDRRIAELAEIWNRVQRFDDSMDAEWAMLMVQKLSIGRRTSDSETELTDDEVLRTARLNGNRKRRQRRWDRSTAKKRRQMDQEVRVPDSLLMETTLNTNDNNKPTYRLANYHNIRAQQHPKVEMRPIAEYTAKEIQPGWLVVNRNNEWDETWLRHHASKRHGTSDLMGTIQNQTLAVVLEIDDTVHAKPYGKQEQGAMRIRTIGEASPIEGWCSISYFYVLTHQREPLYAPETAGDDFWRSVVKNLVEHGTGIGRYYNTQLRAQVNLPYPLPPPRDEWRGSSTWQWQNWEVGHSASSASQWRGDNWNQGWHQGWSGWSGRDDRDQPQQ